MAEQITGLWTQKAGRSGSVGSVVIEEKCCTFMSERTGCQEICSVYFKSNKKKMLVRHLSKPFTKPSLLSKPYRWGPLIYSLLEKKKIKGSIPNAVILDCTCFLFHEHLVSRATQRLGVVTRLLHRRRKCQSGWFLTRRCCFLWQSKDVHARLIGESKLAGGVSLGGSATLRVVLHKLGTCF